MFLNSQIEELVNKTIEEVKLNATSNFSLTNPEIYLHDKFGKISIVAVAIDQNKITLSSSYCQLLWLMCYCAIKKADYDTTNERLNREDEQSKQEFYKFVYTDSEDDNKPIDLKQFPELNNKFTNCNIQTIGQLKNYLRQVIDIPQETIYTFLKLFAKNDNSIQESGLQHLDLSKVSYHDEINTAFKYSLKFILYHELSHIYLKHDLEKEGNIKDEKDADFSSFEHLINGETNKFTAYIGVLCALTSLFFLNPQFEEDDIHPVEYERLFEYYDKHINYDKKDTLLTYLLWLWADTFEIEGFPKLQGEHTKYIQEVKKFFNLN